MRLMFAKTAYEQLDDESRATLKPTLCDCIEVKTGKAQDECPSCDGSGVLYEMILTAEESFAIEENLRKQGIPLGPSN